MRNIFKIINTDAHRIFSSVVVLVILMVTGIEMKLQDGREGTTLYRIWNRGGQTTAPKKPEASGLVFPETEMISILSLFS